MKVSEPLLKAPHFSKHYKLAQLLNDLGNPQNQIRIINVVGTNGKGSTANYLAKQLQLQFLKVGLFTSPAFLEHNERIKINGAMIDDQTLQKYLETYQHLFIRYQLTFFEIWVFLAIHYFLEQQVDVAVIEAGIGGKLDSTNVFENQWAVLLASVSFDHTEILGDTIESILENKVKITRDGNPLFVANSNQQYLDYISSLHPLTVLSSQYLNTPDINQQDNIGLVISFLTYFNLPINYDIFKQAPTAGRMMILRKEPYLVIDGAHNFDAITKLVQNVRALGISNPTFLYATSAKKDYLPIIAYLEQCGFPVYFCSFDHPLAWDLSQVPCNHKIKDWRMFLKTHRQDNVIVCGSLYFIPQVYEYVQGWQED